PQPSYTTTREESHHAKAAKELYACREGRHLEASSHRPRPRLGSLRRASALPHAVLPLAETVLRERTGCFRTEPHRARRPTPANHRRAARQAPAQERGRRGIDGGTYQLKKGPWEPLTGVWVPHDPRDSIVDFVRHWSERAEIPVRRFIGWLGIAASKFHAWRTRYGLANEHNALVPRDWWLEPWEK